MHRSNRAGQSWRMLLALCAALTLADVALGATVQFTYVPDNGYSGFGTVTFPDALLAPNTQVGDATNLNGLTSVSITITGPGLPGGTLNLDYGDLEAWFFSTGAAGEITDLNFFQAESMGCYVDGDFTFFLSVFCGGEEVASLGLTQLVVTRTATSIPAVQPAGLGILALVLAAGGTWALRRRTAAIRTR